jgi:succinate-semialdehyde dehydrogenase/glutarate-semialdehyde dehydrogenase
MSLTWDGRDPARDRIRQRCATARTAKERAVILRPWFDLVMKNQDDLGAIMTAERGSRLRKPKARSRDTAPSFTADRRIIVLKQSIGVCAAITPWNFPAGMITRKAGPALARCR